MELSLSNFQKKALLELRKLDKDSGSLIVLGNIWDELFKNNIMLDISVNGIPYLYVKHSDETTSNNIVLTDVENKYFGYFYELVDLFQSLQNGKFVYCQEDGPFKNLGEIHHEKIRLTSSNPILENVKNYANKRWYLTHRLRSYIDKDFISERDEKLLNDYKSEKKRLNIAILAVIISVFAFLLTAIKECHSIFSESDPIHVIVESNEDSK